jgi:hypothetical protein
MTHPFKTKRRIPAKVYAKAAEILAGAHVVRSVWFDKDVRIINVGPHWRLLNRGSGWWLLSHEDYNAEIRRR